MLLETSQVDQTTHHAMGTVMSHKVFGPHAEESLAAVCREIERLERLLSRFIPESDISRVNASAGLQSQPVSRETFEVLTKAVNFAQLCPGCFDVTIEPLVALWSQSKASRVPPDADSIRNVLPLVNYRDLQLDPGHLNASEMTAGLRGIGQAIDLGGIGKGYAADRILEVFRQYGIRSAYSNLGGNVVTLGSKPDGSPWRVGIQHPRLEQCLIGAVAVVDQTVVTSGDYQRCFIDRRGKRYHHILNPRTGYPADAGLISVSIITDHSMVADALSTILFVAGLERGLVMLRCFPGTDAVLVDAEMNVFITQGLHDRFQAEQGIAVTIVE